MRCRIPVLEGAGRDADGRLRLGARLGVDDGVTAEPSQRTFDRAVGPAGVDLHDLPASPGPGPADPHGDRRPLTGVGGVGGQVVPGRVAETGAEPEPRFAVLVLVP